MKQALATITSNTEVMPKTHLIWVKAPDIAATAKPGQFIMVRCGRELLLRRPLSIHRVKEPDQLCFLFSVAGKGTFWLSQCKEGKNLDLLGPLGKGFTIDPTSKNLLLVAGGIGIAPLVFLAQQSLSQGHVVTLLHGATTASGLYPQQLLPPGVQFVITTEDGSAGNRGRITDILPNFFDWADQIYACGPVAMYQTIAAQRQKGPKKKSIQISLEVRMGCGLGACYGCTIKTRYGWRRVCQDGPIFELDKIIWEEVKI